MEKHIAVGKIKLTLFFKKKMFSSIHVPGNTGTAEAEVLCKQWE